ncbi:MAG TPA: hypothetical protein VMR19_02165 [Candidatus Saccharimonadales bacterium]|jgi:hypothetical protein|nr:hypothetical protein [Candidatus Saccharimonadales bacterium]
MENPNSTPFVKTNKLNTLLVVILGIVTISTLVLGGIYLFYQYGKPSSFLGIFQNNNQGLTAQDIELVHKSSPQIFATDLPVAIVGEKYNAKIHAAVFNLNVPITGKALTELPPGLDLTCSTEYNTQTFSKQMARSSVCTCLIAGVPKKAGVFSLKIAFSIEGGLSNVYKELPLTVSP